MQQIHNESLPTSLLANGTAGIWEIAVDESQTTPTQWFLQIESNVLYLYFQLTGLDVVGKVDSYLQSKRKVRRTDNEGLKLGKFSDTLVKIIRDDEFEDRFFLIAGNSDSAVLRVAVSGKDMKDFVLAFNQIESDLNQ